MRTQLFIKCARANRASKKIYGLAGNPTRERERESPDGPRREDNDVVKNSISFWKRARKEGRWNGGEEQPDSPDIRALLQCTSSLFARAIAPRCSL